MTPLLATLLLCAAVDGDSLQCQGERIRVMGVDTPELQCRCPAECEGAQAAKARTEALIAGGVTLERHGADKYRRVLAVVRLPDGRDLAKVLIDEKLGRPYAGKRRLSWCE